jgi:2-aminoadipate transaminase
LGSFSKILAPGLRLGYLVAPPALYPKLLQAKQAADLHTPSFNQRVVAEVLKDGFIERHVPTIRALYKQQCEAMLAALGQALPQGLAAPRQWTYETGQMRLQDFQPDATQQKALQQSLNALGYTWRAQGDAWLMIAQAKDKP